MLSVRPSATDLFSFCSYTKSRMAKVTSARRIISSRTKNDISRHLFSLMEPMQPRKATTMIMEPMMTSTLPSVREGRLWNSTPKSLWTRRYIPKPKMQQPENQKSKLKKNRTYFNNFKLLMPMLEYSFTFAGNSLQSFR